MSRSITVNEMICYPLLRTDPTKIANQSNDKLEQQITTLDMKLMLANYGPLKSLCGNAMLIFHMVVAYMNIFF